MNNFFKNIIFAFRKPPIVLIFSSEGDLIIKIVSRIAKNLEVVDFTNYKLKHLKFLIKNSSLPVLVILKNISDNQQLQADSEKLIEIVKVFPQNGIVALDYNLPLLRKIKNEVSCPVLTYGLNQEADIFATDINFGENEINFKINYQGKTVPFWFKKKTTNQELNVLLAAILTLVVNKINLVEISQILKEKKFNE